MKNYSSCLEDMQRFSEMNVDRSYRNIVERQRAVFRDFKKDFSRMDNNFQMKIDRLRLLNPGSIHEMSGEETEMQTLLKERGAAHNSLMMADEYLNQASESHSHLVNQRKRLETSSGRMNSMMNRFPTVNSLMSKITDKKNRDKWSSVARFTRSVIVASFIGLCICFLIWYAFH
ncbi:hypothetical protein WA538_003077, partial [Blastocystis sp. DL]